MADFALRTAVKMAFKEATKGYWSDAGSLVYDGTVYAGNCAVCDPDSVEARSDLAMADFAIKLSAADPDILTDFQTLTWHLRRIRVSVLKFEPTLRTVTGVLYSTVGLLEKVTFARGTAALNLSVTDLMRLSVMNCAGYRSHGDQKMRLSTDNFAQYTVNSGKPYDFCWGIRHGKFGNAQVTGLPASKRN